VPDAGLRDAAIGILERVVELQDDAARRALTTKESLDRGHHHPAAPGRWPCEQDAGVDLRRRPRPRWTAARTGRSTGHRGRRSGRGGRRRSACRRSRRPEVASPPPRPPGGTPRTGAAADWIIRLTRQSQALMSGQNPSHLRIAQSVAGRQQKTARGRLLSRAAPAVLSGRLRGSAPALVRVLARPQRTVQVSRVTGWVRAAAIRSGVAEERGAANRSQAPGRANRPGRGASQPKAVSPGFYCQRAGERIRAITAGCAGTSWLTSRLRRLEPRASP
jgi:hypothetical protein